MTPSNVFNQARCIAWIVTITLCLFGSTMAEGDAEGQKPLKITTIEREPYLMYHNDSWRSGNDQYYGFIPDLLEALCKEGALSCDYQLSLVRDGKYGWRYGGTWNGIIGEVFAHEADLGAAPLMVSEFRKQAVDFTAAISNNSITMLVKEEWPIYSKDDLLRLSTGWLKFGTLDSGWTKNAFSTARDVLGTSLWSMMTDFADNMRDGVSKTRSGNYSFLSASDQLEYYSNYYCGLAVRDEFYPAEPNAFAVRKRSGLLGPLNEGLKKLRDNGKFSEIRSKWWHPQCRDTDSSATKPTRLHVFSSILFVILASLIL